MRPFVRVKMLTPDGRSGSCSAIGTGSSGATSSTPCRPATGEALTAT